MKKERTLIMMLILVRKKAFEVRVVESEYSHTNRKVGRASAGLKNSTMKRLLVKSRTIDENEEVIEIERCKITDTKMAYFRLGMRYQDFRNENDE